MTPTVAEFALAMTLNLLRDIPAAVQQVRSGNWLAGGWAPAEMVHGDLTGRRIGLAGYGSINRRFRELLVPFRCSVMAFDPFVSRGQLGEEMVKPVETLAELASRSEIFVVGIPPTAGTLGIVDAEVIDALPQGAAVVVVTRMAVVDQVALWRRAGAGEIRVAVDVFEPEPPPPGASFRTDPSVLPTPHIAGNVGYCHRRCFTTACADAVAVLAGQQPRYQASVRDQLLYQGRLGQGD
jgi:phosphoglycerate dehydrogenase-like enzyme